MKFHDFSSLPTTYYENNSNLMAGYARQEWVSKSRPYYKCWPSIVSCLSRTSLDFVLTNDCLPERVLLIRFAEKSEPKIGEISIKSILSWRGEFSNGRCFYVEHRTQHSEADKNDSLGVFWIPPDSNKTIEEKLLEIKHDSRKRWDEFTEYLESGGEVKTRKKLNEEQDVLLSQFCLKISLTCHLLAEDPSIITPDVLSADRDRYESETDEAWKQRAVDRARRRGIVGWNIGADYEVCPHYRRPHFGLRYTGKGRTVPRIVPIKGAVVHRSKLTEVPTGYILPDGTEVEK